MELFVFDFLINPPLGGQHAHPGRVVKFFIIKFYEMLESNICLLLFENTSAKAFIWIGELTVAELINVCRQVLFTTRKYFSISIT